MKIGAVSNFLTKTTDSKNKLVDHLVYSLIKFCSVSHATLLKCV